MTTLIFGHKKPDTDSVMSAIALSYLKNQLNENTKPRILGRVNKETAYALKYFGLKEPKYLNDVKLQLKDIDYHKGLFLKETDSIYEGYELMMGANITGIPIVKQDFMFSGLITIKDMAKKIVRDNIDELYTSMNNLVGVLKAEEVVKFDDEIIGRVLVASYSSSKIIVDQRIDKNTILIVGDRPAVIDYAIESNVKLLILTGNVNLKEELIQKAKNNNINVLKVKEDTYHVAKLITLTNYLKTIFSNSNPIRFYDTDYVDDVIDINNKLRHTNYPILAKDGKCLGLLKITDLNNKSPKKVILVDHNEKLQSADGIDEAQIVEIIDHHNLGSITTNTPVNFRNMAVGSTCTIIYIMFKEKNINIPKDIAGALLSGILSDTLVLKSPTATSFDGPAIVELSKIAGVDYKEYGMNLLKAGTSIEGMSKEEVLYNDYKLYNVSDKTFAIGQFMTMDFEEIKKDINGYIKIIDEVAEANNFELVCLYVTDIIKNGSYIIYNSKGKNIIETAYGIENVEQGFFIEKCLSRKKHVIPVLMSVLEN